MSASKADWDTIKERAAALLEAGGHEDRIADLMPSARLVPDPQGPSQLGGQPLLAPGQVWPQRDGRCLHHLAQVDLADAPPQVLDELAGLGPEGLLTVFYDATALNEGEGGWGEWPQDLGACVVLLVNDPGASLAEWPENLDEEYRYPAVACSLEIQAELWDSSSLTDEDLFREFQRDGHKLGGPAAPVQDDPREECPDESDEAPPVGALDLRQKSPAEWKLLLQLDSDEELGWMWGDVGRVYVYAPRADIRAGGRLDRSWAIMQCH